MAEPAKVAQYYKTERPKVLSLRTGEGGVDFGIHGQLTLLPPGGKFVGAHSGLHDLTMELDRSLGGVAIRYFDKANVGHTVLVPMGHIRQMELAE